MSDLTQAALAPGGGRTMQRVRALVRSRSGLIGLILIAMLTILSLFSAFGWLPHDPIAQDPPSRLQSPSLTHFFGTDQFGRDVFSRVAAGVANSALISVVAVAFAAIVGTLCGVSPTGSSAV
jgi:peptide/nickel transport system permease protein